MVCKSSDHRIKSDDDMVKTCFDSVKTSGENEKSCSCIPTRIVEQDLEAQTSPLGQNSVGCITVEQEIVLKGLKGK